MQKFISSIEEFQTKSNAFVIKVERIPNIQPKRFEKSKYLNFYIRIFIDIDNTSTSKNIYLMNDISFVRYELDPSYVDPIRISKDRTKNFELKVWTYGFYRVKATIYLNLGSPIDVYGEVKFDVTEEEKKMNREELE
jgi:hypothetical protein